MSEIIVDIPNYAGWSSKKIDQLCSVARRGTAPVYVENSSIKAIGQRCVTHRDFEPSYARPHSEKAILNILEAEENDVLLNSTGTGTIGRSVIFNDSGKYMVDGHVTVLRPHKEVVDSRWLNAVIRSKWFQRHLERFCYTGSTNQLELSRTYLNSSSLPIPAKEEQTQIGDVLDSIDTQIRETEAIVAKLQQVKQGLLHDLLTRGTDKNGELRPSYEDAPELYKPSGLGWIPKEWYEVSLADISTIKSGSTPSRAKAEIYFCSEGGFPWVKTMDLNEDVIVQTGEQITQKALDKTSCTLYPKESVLVAMYGGWEQIGRVAMLADEAATNQAISALIFNKDDITSEFVLRSLQFHRPRWKKVAASTRKDPNITKSDVERFKIAIPENTDEQKYVVKIYREIINEANAEKLNLDKLISKKEGLVDDLLTGKVRVTELLKQKLAS